MTGLDAQVTVFLAMVYSLSNPVVGMDKRLHKKYQSGKSLKDRVMPAVLTALATSILMYLLYTVNFDLLYGVGASAIIFASFGSSAFLLFMMPRIGSSRVSSFVRSYIMAAIIGEAGFYASFFMPVYVIAGIVVFALSMLMYATSSLHPPAIAIALAFVLYRIGVYGILIVALGVVILIFLRKVLERFVYIIERNITRELKGRRRA